MVVVSISIPNDLLVELDAVLGKEWFASRSEVMRQAIRKYISEYRELELLKGDVIATITILYDKADQNTDQVKTPHEFGDLVTAYLHSHLTENNCLEVMVVKGKSERLKDLVDGIKANRHVQQIKLSVMAVE